MTDAWDAAAWERLRAELDRWPAGAATLWWRDDDAGIASPAFDRLLTLAAAHAVPLALAVVPTWLDDMVAAKIREAPAGVHVLQHGYAHRNHEPPASEGTRQRPAELGSARPVDAALAELAAGRARLAALVPTQLRAALVPPWNRIAPAIQAALPSAGYRILSTFAPRSSVWAAPGLRALNCHVDPIQWRAGKRFGGAAWTLDQVTAHLTARRAKTVDPSEPTGLLTHHRDFPPVAWDFLEALLAALSAHPSVSFPAPDQLLGVRA